MSMQTVPPLLLSFLRKQSIHLSDWQTCAPRSTEGACIAGAFKIIKWDTYWKQALCQVSWRTFMWNESWISPPQPAQ